MSSQDCFRARQYGLVFYNYKGKVQDLSLQGIFTLNNVRFHKQKNGFLVYVGGGIGGTLYHTMVNALDGSGNPWNFSSIPTSNSYKNKKQILDALKALMAGDDTYETEAETHHGRRPVIGKNTFRPSRTILAGMAFKLSKRINLALEDRWTIIKDDLLDVQHCQEH